MPALVLIYRVKEFVINIRAGQRQDSSRHFIGPLIGTQRPRLFQRGKVKSGFVHSDDLR